jgi:hypothetical protein
VDRKINVVQEREFEFHAVSQDCVDRKVGAYYFNVFVVINNSSNYLAYN